MVLEYFEKDIVGECLNCSLSCSIWFNFCTMQVSIPRKDRGVKDAHTSPFRHMLLLKARCMRTLGIATFEVHPVNNTLHFRGYDTWEVGLLQTAMFPVVTSLYMIIDIPVFSGHSLASERDCQYYISWVSILRLVSDSWRQHYTRVNESRSLECALARK